MLNQRSLKVFLLAFLFVLAGGLILIGTAAPGFADNPPNASLAAIAWFGLVLILLGLSIGLVAGRI